MSMILNETTIDFDMPVCSLFIIWPFYLFVVFVYQWNAYDSHEVKAVKTPFRIPHSLLESID